MPYCVECVTARTAKGAGDQAETAQPKVQLEERVTQLVPCRLRGWASSRRFAP